MLTSQIILEVFADEDGEMPPERVHQLLADADYHQQHAGHHQGAVSAPLEYVEPIARGDHQPWGLRIRIFTETGDE